MSLVLRLHNFFIHRDRTFEIPLKGFHKLSGNIGTGKSSIFAAICWGFFGKIPRTKISPISFGAKECSVEMEIVGPTQETSLNLVRSSKKNTLTVTYCGIDYVDDEGAAVINEFLGMDYKEFHLSSYIVQNGTGQESLLRLLPAEKLAFFENLVYKNDDAEKFQEDIKKRKADAEQNLNKKKGELVAYEKQLASISSVTSVPKPDKKKSTIETKIRALTSKIDDLSSDISHTRSAIQVGKRREKSLQELQMRVSLMEAEVEEPEQDYESELAECNDTIALLNDAWQKLKKMKDIKKELDFLETYITEEEPPDEQTILSVEAELHDLEIIEVSNSEYTRTEASLEKVKSDMKNVFKEIKAKYGFFEKVPSAEIAKLRSLLSQKGLVCPCCKKKVDYLDGVLTPSVASKNIAATGGADVRKYITTIETLVAKKKELEASFAGMCYLETPEVSAVKEAYDNLLNKKKTYENSLGSIKRRDTLVKEYASLVKEYGREPEEGEFESVTQTKESVESRKKNLVATRQKALAREKLVEDLMARISIIEKEKEETNTPSEDLLTALVEEKDQLIREKDDLHAEYVVAAEYEKYLELVGQIEKMKLAHASSVAEIKTLDATLESYYALERKAKEARLVALLEKIEDINFRASQYLEELFTDSISVKLVPTAPAKGAKIQIKTEIHFKGQEYSDFRQFSGGETQLAELAFFLAVNDSIKSRFLFLDECLNNLHQDSNVDILNYLKSKSLTRLILVVSHESSDGVFDTIIPVEE